MGTQTSEAEKEMREWCVALPKVELHAHLNGSVRNSTLLELAKELGDKGVIVFEDVKDVIMKNDRSLPECFRLFDLFHILTTDHYTVTRIAKEVVGDFAAENVVYLEIRTTPKNNEAKGMTKRSYMDAAVKGLKSVEDVDVVLFDSNLINDEKLSCTPMSDLGGDKKRKKIYVRLLLSIDRRETTSAALDTVNLAMEMKDQGVIGIDLSGNLVVGEWETYLPALEHAKELGIPTTIHCGEVPNRKEIQAMLDFCPQRLGHVCCLDDEEWKKLKSSMIPVEICLTSNVMTGGAPSLELHHFADLYNAKHPLSICTDDSGLFSTSLSNEYYLIASTFGLSQAELFRLAQGAVEFVFADDEVKKSLRAVFERAAAAERPEHRHSSPPLRPRRLSEDKSSMEYTEVLKLRGLPYSATIEDIIKFFVEYELTEENVHIAYRSDGKATGEAFVEFPTAEVAKTAMCKDKMTIGTRYVELFPSTPEEASRARPRGWQ